MPPKRKIVSKSKHKRSNFPSTVKLTDWFGGVENPAVETWYTTKDAPLPPLRAFRVRAIKWQLIAFEGKSCCAQLKVMGPIDTTAEIWSSGPLIIGSVPKIGSKSFSSALWFTSDKQRDSTNLISVEQICQTKVEADQLRFVIEVCFELRPETFSGGCPTSKLSKLTITSPSSSSDSNWVDI